MNVSIKSLSELHEECYEIQKFLEITVSEEINEIVERGHSLSVYMARTGKMLADAKIHKDIQMQQAIKESEESPLSASTINKLIDSKCKTENYLVNWIDRMNRTCTHQMDWCRTVLSKAKEEMRISGYNR